MLLEILLVLKCYITVNTIGAYKLFYYKCCVHNTTYATSGAVLLGILLMLKCYITVNTVGT